MDNAGGIAAAVDIAEDSEVIAHVHIAGLSDAFRQSDLSQSVGANWQEDSVLARGRVGLDDGLTKAAVVENPIAVGGCIDDQR